MNGEEDTSEGQTQCLCTLHGAIHVMLLLDLVTALRSDILSIKMNVFVVTVPFFYDKVSNIKMFPFFYLSSNLFSQKNLQLLP